MAGLFNLHGGDGGVLTGLESRTLRALLHLERRHVAVLARILGRDDATTARVTQWEVSKGRGYPPPLVELLQDLETAVGDLALELAASAARSPDGSAVTLVRPNGAMRIMALLRLPQTTGRAFTDEQIQWLAEDGGDFWQRLCDAAITRAAWLLNLEVADTVRVVFDQRPGGDS